MNLTDALACVSLSEPACARRLVLHECLDLWQREARPGVVDTGRYRCRFVVWGQGPTLVLVPGMAMDAVGFVMLMARLRQQFRCVSFDFPGGAGDGAHLMTYRLADYVADLFALLDHLSIQSCHLLASSFGTPIALAAMHRHPGRFRRAILQGAFARQPLSGAEVLAASFARFVPGRLGSLPFVERVLLHNAGAEFQAREPEVWRFFVDHNLRVPLRVFAARALLLDALDLRSILPTLALPVLLVNGDRDRLLAKDRVEEMKQGLPCAAHGEIEACGHFPQLTHPEVLAEIVHQYLPSAT
ncbi:MAG: alpha/beta hydrolase [Planctomycetes bacterium]|nr:alpha/beta hydrolase [Planctomycetota bacterium]